MPLDTSTSAITLKRAYTEADAYLYEQVFLATEGANTISDTIEALKKASKEKGNERLAAHPWSFAYLCEMYQKQSYLEWKADYLELMRNQAELSAYRYLSNPSKLTSGNQVATNACLTIASGKLEGFDSRLGRFRKKVASGVAYEGSIPPPRDGGLAGAVLSDAEE